MVEITDLIEQVKDMSKSFKPLTVEERVEIIDDMTIEIENFIDALRACEKGGTQYVGLKIQLNNAEYKDADIELMFDIFELCIAFDKEMEINNKLTLTIIQFLIRMNRAIIEVLGDDLKENVINEFNIRYDILVKAQGDLID